ncbi:MAG: hypothetical protein AB1646_25665 [Thermodesulfobacteriota bacterium]
MCESHIRDQGCSNGQSSKLACVQTTFMDEDRVCITLRLLVENARGAA